LNNVVVPREAVTAGSDLLVAANERKVALEQALTDLAHANRDLGILNERLDALRLVAEEAQKTKTAFVAKISHEFRTPLNMIIGLIDTLTETPDIYGQSLPPALLEDLEIVHRNSNHLASMINDVLDLSQTEGGHLTLHREWVDLAEDIDTALTVVQPLVDKKQLWLQVDIPNGLPPVYCDKTRIRQVILNLVSNAARYTETGGITVAARQEETQIVVKVIDTGPGIAADDLEQIFDPFCQGTDAMWLEQGGSGLGLSISKQFIERHNGRIWVESEPGQGSTFCFKLPISPARPVGDSPKRWLSEDWVFFERPVWPKIPQLPYKQRIILCDETGDLYAQLTRHFEEIEFIDTIDLAHTTEALRHHPAHAVIFNTVSPDRLTDLLAQARREIPDTPLLGCSLPPRVEQFLEAGAVDYLIKPVVREDLTEAIQALDTPVRRILIADDNHDFQKLLTRMLLIHDPRLEVVTASDGRATLEALEQARPDLVLLDILMPDMSGWQVLAQKKMKEEAVANIPVIMVTAEDPAQQLVNSEVLLTTTAQGLSITQVLQCSLQFSKLLLHPIQVLDPEPG
ncbi:MAG: ATP-binding protein, partial [Anaerolineae bacterium]|nr:ATP-binding protein [Anaerolineae bacterium]